MNSLELTPAVFSILSGLIEDKVGIHYGLLDRDILGEKAASRAMEAGFESLLDYYYFLRYDSKGEQELGELVENLVVNETYFFREWLALKNLVDHFVTPLCAAGLKPRIWSAACSTGEEPLTLAMLLNERGLLGQVEIVASDISQRVLAKAQSGRFGRRSIRQVPDQAMCDRYVTATSSGYEVQPSLISAIQWRQQNLLACEEFSKFGKFDVVICRNVLIYFADATVKTILRGISSVLVPEGLLLVGVSESLLRYGNGFTGEEHSGSFIYRKSDECSQLKY